MKRPAPPRGRRPAGRFFDWVGLLPEHRGRVSLGDGRVVADLAVGVVAPALDRLVVHDGARVVVDGRDARDAGERRVGGREDLHGRVTLGGRVVTVGVVAARAPAVRGAVAGARAGVVVTARDVGDGLARDRRGGARLTGRDGRRAGARVGAVTRLAKQV